MRIAVKFLAGAVLTALSSVALAGTSPASLPGYAAGAEIVRVPIERAQIDEIGDVVYAQIKSTRSVRALHMSVLVPRTDDLKPAILYLPGGGFTSAEHDKFLQMRSALAAAGFVVAAAEYRVVPDTFPAPLVDGKAAIRYLRQHAADYGIDPARIGVIGDSAGGWLSQLLATTGEDKRYDQGDFLDQSSAVQAAVSMYGISDVRNIGDGFPAAIQQVHASAASTEALLLNGPAFASFAGAPVGADQAKALEAGAMGHLDGAKPPMLLMHGSADTLVSPIQSKQLYEALRKRGDRVDYVLVEGAGHGDLHWYQAPVIERVVTWFRKALGAPIKGATKAAGPGANL